MNSAESVQVVDFISDKESDTHVLLARWSSLLVIAFRGTSSRTNWLNNARFKQVHSACIFAHILFNSLEVGVRSWARTAMVYFFQHHAPLYACPSIGRFCERQEHACCDAPLFARRIAYLLTPMSDAHRRCLCRRTSTRRPSLACCRPMFTRASGTRTAQSGTSLWFTVKFCLAQGRGLAPLYDMLMTWVWLVCLEPGRLEDRTVWLFLRFPWPHLTLSLT